MFNKRVEKGDSGFKAIEPSFAGVVHGLRRVEYGVKTPPDAILQRFSSRERSAMARRIAEPLEFFDDSAFGRRDAEAQLLVSLPERSQITVAPPAADDADADVAPRAAGFRLNGAEEIVYFRRYNYCRYRIARLLRPFKGKRLTLGAARELLIWDGEASASRNLIAQANLGLVPAMLKRCRPGAAELGDLIGEGYLALLRAIDKFDYSRGFKFSTYACRAILSSFARLVYVSGRDRRHAPTEFDPRLETPEAAMVSEASLDEEYLVKLRRVMDGNRANLNAMEQTIICQRFGLCTPLKSDDSGAGMTLGEIAEPIGLTRERVRQIQNTALTKLRTAMMEPASEKN